MPIRLDIAPDPSTVEGYAQDAIRQMQTVYGIQMDHSVDSLAHVDRVLGEWREGGAPIEAVTKSLYALGSYAGEILRQQANGRWVEPPEEQYGQLDSLFMFVQLPDGREWRPIAMVFYALMGKPERTLEETARALLVQSA